MDLNICYSNTLPQQRSPQLPPQLEEKDDELVLQDCLEPFKSKDYIMEPEIFTSVKRLMSNTDLVILVQYTTVLQDAIILNICPIFIPGFSKLVERQSHLLIFFLIITLGQLNLQTYSQTG